MRRGLLITASSAATLGILAAVVIIFTVENIRSNDGHGNRKLLLEVQDSGIRNRYLWQRRAIAASQSLGSTGKARFSLLKDDPKLAEDLYSSAGYIPSNESLGDATPEALEFECGGADAGQTCFDASQACLTSAESVISNLYLVDPVSATETRANSVCKCFVSNGCSPSCNVAMYSQWSSRSGILCPANPPTYDSETGVYQYGDPAAEYLAPTDLSFDFYPNFPNPAGHQYNRAWARDVYEDEPGVGSYQPPLHARFRAGVKPQLLPSTLDGPWAAPDTRGLGLDAVYCGDDATIGCGDASGLAPPA